MKKKGPAPNFKKPWWQRRLERSIEQWRQDLGRVLEIRKGVQLKERVVKELERRYQLSERGRTTVVSFLKNKIQAASTKIKNFVKNNITSRQNKLFQTNQSRLYKEFAGQTSRQNEAPNSEEARVFWEEIWSREGKHQEESAWLNDVENAHSELECQTDIEILQ